MLGCYDFCGHYDWTFDWLEKEGGKELLHRYWEEAIHGDSQDHATREILAHGIEGMEAYWGHTLEEEAPTGGFVSGVREGRYTIEMTDCPSRGFLLRNGIEFSKDYCDHCIGWIGPLMKKAGYTVHHAHNHCGQCYWEMRPEEESGTVKPGLEAWKKALLETWEKELQRPVHRFEGAQSARRKADDA